MIEARITNKLEIKIKEYQEKTGCTKTWLSKKMGYKSRQAFDGVLASRNPSLETLALFARELQCDIKDLYEIEFYEEGQKINF